eukprot:5229004-Amphidinium_carterae.1
MIWGYYFKKRSPKSQKLTLQLQPSISENSCDLFCNLTIQHDLSGSQFKAKVALKVVGVLMG